MNTKERKCFAHHFMTFEEYGLWTYAREVSHESGIFYFDGRKVAARFSNQRKRIAYRVAKNLARKGWFHTLQSSRRDQNTGLYKATEYQPVSLAEWAVKHGREYEACRVCIAGASQTETGTSPGSETGEVEAGPVSCIQQSRFEDSPVPFRASTSRGSGTQSDNENVIKINGKRESNQPTEADGWLELLPTILEEETGKLYRMTEADADKIRQLGNIYGPIPVLAAFCQFTQRPEGFAGLVRPFSVFGSEAQWIEKAYKEAYDFAEISSWPNGQRFLTALDAPNAPIGEDEKRLLFTVWTTLELNKDLLAMLVSEQDEHEQFAAIAEMHWEPAGVPV